MLDGREWDGNQSWKGGEEMRGGKHIAWKIYLEHSAGFLEFDRLYDIGGLIWKIVKVKEACTLSYYEIVDGAEESGTFW